MSGATSAGPTPPNANGQDVKMPEEGYVPQHTKHFSSRIAAEKMEEYKAGKYTEKYIRTYLDYIHLEGIITNLQYLDFKKQLQDEQ